MKLTRLLRLCAFCLLVSSLAAQTTRNYSDGETVASPFDTTGDPLSLSILNGTATQSGLLFGTGSVTKIGAGSVILTNDNTYTGGTTISDGTLQIGNGGGSGWIVGNVLNNGTLNFHRTGDNEFTGVISGSGHVTHQGGVLRFSEVQTYAGNTTISSGILVLPTSQDFGLAASSLVTIGGGALDISNRQQRIAGLVGTGTVYSFGGSDGTLTLDVGAGETHTFSGALGSSYHTFSLVKEGAGTQILTGSNSFSGSTTVRAGTLVIEGSLATSPVNVQAGGILRGNGVIGGPLHFASGASLRFDPTETLTINAASVTFDGFGIQNLVGLDAATPDGIYTVLDGSAVFDFANVLNVGRENAFDLGGGKLAWLQEGSLQVVVIPEPSVVALVALSLLGLLASRRKASMG